MVTDEIVPDTSTVRYRTEQKKKNNYEKLACKNQAGDNKMEMKNS